MISVVVGDILKQFSGNRPYGDRNLDLLDSMGRN